jgi:hypothetical protein
MGPQATETVQWPPLASTGAPAIQLSDPLPRSSVLDPSQRLSSGPATVSRPTGISGGQGSAPAADRIRAHLTT